LAVTHSTPLYYVCCSSSNCCKHTHQLHKQHSAWAPQWHRCMMLQDATLACQLIPASEHLASMMLSVDIPELPAISSLYFLQGRMS
jgi:hypothetical protein